MTTSASLSRMHLASKLCRRGAWLIVAAGLAVIGFMIINSVSNYQADSGQNVNGLLTTCAIALLIAIPVSFFSLILSAMGALLDYICIEKNTEEASDDRIEIVSLPDMR